MASSSTVKTDWYQTESAIVVTVLYRNLKQEELEVKFTETDLNILIHKDGIEHKLDFHLAHKIVPNYSTYKIMSTKVEIKLKKFDGIRWERLEGDPNTEYPKCIPQSTNFTEKPPSYPTSKGTNWNVIEQEIIQQEANEKPEGEEALNKLFQEIYGKGSDDVKRAMNKSYMESGGTVLSTNWEDISKSTVDVKPPEGMEWKKWDS